MDYVSGDTEFNVYKTEFAGTAKNTVAIWRMKDIRTEVARLRARGVVFEEYDFGEDGKTVDGIMSDEDGDANAWFRTPRATSWRSRRTAVDSAGVEFAG